MNDLNPYPLAPSQFSAAQRKALDMIGLALKKCRIDFKTAAELGDLVKHGREVEVAQRLKH